MKSATIIVVVILLLAGVIYLEYINDFGRPKNNTNGHIYIGTIFIGSPIKTQSVSAYLYFKGGINDNKTQYYVVLSAWDDNKSYDQVGISSIDGMFFATYSYTTLVNGTIRYHYNPHWFRIYPGLHYLSESLSSGEITFNVDSHVQRNYTGGNYLTLSTNEIIGKNEYNGFTVYEEIYSFSGSFPQISYNFSHISYGGSTPITKWKTFDYNVSLSDTGLVAFQGSTVNIYNQKPSVLKFRVIAGEGQGYVNVSDFSLQIKNNETYSVPVIKGMYDIGLYFSVGSTTYNRTLTKTVDGVTWMNVTLRS